MSNVISLDGKSDVETAPAPRVPNVFAFYKNGEKIAESTGFLNLSPDFAAVVTEDSDVRFVIQFSAYDYVKNLGPEA